MAPSPSAIAAGPEFGSKCSTTRLVSGSSRVRSPEDGATHTALPCAATDPGPPGTRFTSRFVVLTTLNCGSIALTDTLLASAFDWATQIALAPAASPVGGPSTGKLCSVLSDIGS